MDANCALGPSVAKSGRRMHRVLAVLASVALLVLTLVPCVALAEVDTSGKPTGYWGTAPYWVNKETKEIVIGSEGQIPDDAWDKGCSFRDLFSYEDSYGTSISFQDGLVLPKNCEHLFRYGFFKSIDLHNVDFSGVESVYCMFAECPELQSIDLTGLDFSHVKHAAMFLGWCDNLKTVDMHGTDFSGLQDEGSNSGMFDFFFYDTKLESVDMSGCTLGANCYSEMFGQCWSLKRVDFDGIKVVHSWDGGEKPDYSLSVGRMFAGCGNLESVDLSKFNTSGFTNFGGMFSGCASLKDVKLGGVDTSDAKYMDGMFRGCKSLASLDVSGFDTRNAKSMSSMFEGCSSLASLDLSSFDTSSAVEEIDQNKSIYLYGTKNMLSGCTSLKELKLSDGFYKASNDLRKSVALPDVSAMTGYDAGAYSGRWVRTDGSVPALASAGLTGNAVPEGSSYAGTWVWQDARTLNYDANGGEGAPAARPFWFGDRDAVSAEVPARASYDFLGWNTAADGSGVAVQPGGEIPYEAADGTALVDEKGLTLYAQWREQTYPITYDPTGGTWDDGTTGTVAKTYGKASDSATALEGPARKAYDFVGWNTAADGTGTSYAKGAELPKGEDLTLYAQWREQTYTITYDPAGGTWADGTAGTVAKAYGKASDPAKILAAPTREGYKFVRWEGSSYQPGDAYDERGGDGLLADDTLTAVWEEVPAPSGDNPGGKTGAGTTVPATGASDELPARPGATAKPAPKVPETGDSGLGGIAAALAALGAAALAGVAGIRLSSDRR